MSKKFVLMVSRETNEVFVEAELSETKIKTLSKSYEKAGWPVTVVYGKAA